MKVLKEGNGQKGWAREITCDGSGSADNTGLSGCGALLLVEEADIVYTGEKGGNYRESGDPCYGFICPECEQITDIEDLPRAVTRKIPKQTNSTVKQIMGWIY